MISKFNRDTINFKGVRHDDKKQREAAKCRRPGPGAVGKMADLGQNPPGGGAKRSAFIRALLIDERYIFSSIFFIAFFIPRSPFHVAQ